MNPQDYAVPPEYRHWVGDAAEDHIGPFFFRMENEVACTAFRVRDNHCNGHKSVHGGMLMAFADYTLCIAANAGSNESVATVTCNNEFIAPAFAGDLILGRGEVTRRGGSLVFVRVVLESNGQVILTSSGVIKILRNGFSAPT